MLLDSGLIFERDCPACKLNYEMWEHIIEDAGSAEYGHLAFYIIGVDSDLEVNPRLAESLPAWEHEGVKVWRIEKSRFERSQSQQVGNRQQLGPDNDDE